MSTPAMRRSSTSISKGNKAFARILSYLKRYRGRLILGGASLVVSNVLLLANPWILKLTIDALKSGMERKQLFFYSLLLILVALASGLFRFFMRRIMIGVSRKIEFDLRQDFFSHLETFSPSFYGRNRTGDLMALATNDLNAVRALVGPGVMYSMTTAVVTGLAISLMVALSWKLTLIALMPMVSLTIAVYHSVRAIHRHFERVQKKFASLNSRAQENLSGIRVVKAYAREDHEISEFRKLSLSYVGENMKLFRIQSLLMPMLTLVAGLGALFILAFGGKQVIDGSLSLGSFVAFSAYLTMLLWPMISLGWVMNITQRGLASMERIERVLQEKTDIFTPATADVARPRSGSIRFENVSFGYGSPSDRELVLKKVSLTIEDGESVAIVGPTGSGKTTIVELILRLYDPLEGEIFVGGEPVRKIPLEELRRIAGLVPQDVFLFSETIRENIGFGVSSLDGETLERVSRIAAIGEEIDEFPNRFQTLVGERGINLSGGQKQRIAIARALAKEPRILILDDALSSVDADTEKKILSMLRLDIRKRTSILISHRISTIKEADRILVLDSGRIVEEGTHENLLRRGGYYAEMYYKQLLAADVEEGL